MGSLAVNAGDVAAWVERYVRAWNSNDPKEIGGLFTKEAAYYPGPFDAPWMGREQIVTEWLARRDEPGDTTFRYEVLAAAGDTGVVRGWTVYMKQRREFSNIWVVRFGTKRLCREYTEWWIQRRR